MLADLHIHMILDGVNFRTAIGSHKPRPADEIIRRRLENYRTLGVTFLRDGGDAWGVSLRAKELGKEYGIDYRSPAFPIYKNGHYGKFIGRGFETFEEYLSLLDEAERAGADYIKIMISGLMDFSRLHVLTEEGLEPEEIRRMIDAAHDRGFAVMAHANGDGPVNAALDAGVDSVEHGAYLSRETLLRLKESIWIPTLSTIGNLIGCGRFPDEVLKPLLREQQEKVQFVYDHGGHIGLGSDAGAYKVLHGDAIATERHWLSGIPTAHLEQTEARVRKVFHR